MTCTRPAFDAGRWAAWLPEEKEFQDAECGCPGEPGEAPPLGLLQCLPILGLFDLLLPFL